MNIFDYLKWRGDLTFKQDSFNIVDNLLFSELIYTDLSGIVHDDGRTITIKEAAELYFERNDEKRLQESKSMIALAPFVFKEMAKSKRYGNLKLHHYVNIIDDEYPVQFRAIQIDLNQRETFLAYCGTDDTLIGWKEDLQMSYQLIRSQMEAVKYLNGTTRLTRRYYIGGHSKGGNLALYAACNCQNFIKDRIISVINNDGPDLSNWLYDDEKFRDIKDRYLKIVPDSSVIGMIFFADVNTSIVKSDAGIGNSHSITSWQIEGKDLVYAEKRSESSEVTRQALELFVAKTTAKEREQFVDNLFAAFEQADIHNVSEMFEKGLPVVIRLLKIMAEDDYSFSEISGEMLKCFLAISNEKVSNLVSEVPNKAQNLIDDLGRKIKKKQ